MTFNRNHQKNAQTVRIDYIKSELANMRDQSVHNYRNAIVLSEIKRIDSETKAEFLELDLDTAIKSKYNAIANYLTLSSFTTDNIEELIQQQKEKQIEVHERRIVLCRKVTGYVRTLLETLDVTWSVVEEFKHYYCEGQYQKDAKLSLEGHYTNLVDNLLIKAKILYINVLIQIYDNKDFTTALETLRNILDKRLKESKEALEYTEQELMKYNKEGEDNEEFETLLAAYYQLLKKIRKAEDDVQMFKRQ